MIKVICVTGVAGSGKTTYAKNLCEEKKYTYLDVNETIRENKEVISGYDEEIDTKIIDVDKLRKILIEKIKNSKEKLVIDSHLSHFLNKKYVERVVVVETSVGELRKRLEKRGYNRKKIEENLEAEIMDVCYNEAREKGHAVEKINPWI